MAEDWVMRLSQVEGREILVQSGLATAAYVV